MNEAEKRIEPEPSKTCFTLVSMIEGIENRLRWSEIAFILMNLMVIFSIMNFLADVITETGNPLSPVFMLFIFFSHAVGISINAYWTASSNRLQLKLKLRYFQARYLERKIGRSGEFILSDESLFFNPRIGKVESPDGKETVVYPKEGLLRMDGFVGAAKPRVLSLMMPFLFFVVYLTSLISIVVMLFF